MVQPSHLFAALSLSILSLATAAADTISSYSGCKRADDEQACIACLKSNNLYNFDKNTKQWVCGLVGGGPPPPPPRKLATPKKPPLGKHFTTYATVSPGETQLGSAPTEEGRGRDEEQRTVVKVTRAFLIKATEVTQGEWFNVMGQLHRSYQDDCGMDCPITDVSWFHAIEYLNKLSEREKREPCYDTSGDTPVWTKGLDCKGYRLPTEAEWVMAARAGSTDARHGEVDDIAWTSENSKGKPHPVATKQPNALGLHDMLGNVAEIVYDAWDRNTPPRNSVDPIRHEIGEAAMKGDRTRCGGDFGNGEDRARAAARQAFPGATSSRYVGFRPVRTK